MEFEYTLDLDLPLEEAWATLMDLERIAPCMPGAKIESHDGDTYSGRLKVKLGPMEMTYRGDIQFIERDDAAKRAVVDAKAKEIKGRGEAKTQVTMSGVETADGSRIHLVSEFAVSGKAAQFGRGVMEEVGAKLMDDFAARLGRQVGAARSGAATAPDTAATPAVTAANTAAPTAAPATVAAQPATTPPEPVPEALDLGHAAGASLARRLVVPAIVVAVVIVLVWLW